MLEKGGVQISDVSKKYLIGREKENSLRGRLAQLVAGKKSNSDEFWALRNVDLDIAAGDVVGIIGRNGAGKSTLLKLLSNITRPTSGRIELHGRVASLLEVGTGFHPELTGRENIYLNGTILGMSKVEVKDKFDEIVNFSGIDKFLDTPVKHYSSGMYVRLAFSVAAHLEPEILLIDEVLAVGDQEFQNKCLGKMQDVSSSGRTVFFVSHNMAAVKKLCTKGVFLEKGIVKKVGEINEVISEYIRSGSAAGIHKVEHVKRGVPVAFKSIAIKSSHGELCSEFTVDEKVLIEFNFEIRSENHPYKLFVIIKDNFDSAIFAAEKKIDSDLMTLQIEERFLTRGRYSLHTFIHIPKVEQIDVAKDVCGFTITDATSSLAIHGSYEYGNVFGNYKWI